MVVVWGVLLVVVFVVVDEVVVVVGVCVAALCFFFGFAAFFLAGAVVVVLVVDDVVEFVAATVVPLEAFAPDPQAARTSASPTVTTPVRIFTTPESIHLAGRSGASRARASL